MWRDVSTLEAKGITFIQNVGKIHQPLSVTSQEIWILNKTTLETSNISILILRFFQTSATK